MKNYSFSNKIKFATPADFVLILAVLLTFILLITSALNESKNLRVVVHKDGKEIYSVELCNVLQAYEYKIYGEFGITLLIENNGVTVIESECKDKICQNTGKLTKSGQTSVCLPAKVVITILDSESSESSIDGVAR